LSLLASPVLLASQNWDDHDRSQKYSALNNAKSYLYSCQKNAILYTIGDNDTFPLWYAQDVESERRDMRLINTALLNTDWYIDQAKRKIYESEPLNISMHHKQYVYGTRDGLLYNPIKDTLDIKDFIKLCLNEKFTAEDPESGQTIYLYPSKYIRVPVNKENVLKYGIVAQKDADKIVDEIIINIGERGIYKNSLAMLNELANNDWTRPIYFSGGSFGDPDYLWMKEYLQLDGLTYKLVPIHTKYETYDYGRIDTDTMYANVKKWKWGNMNKNIYLDPETRRNSLIYRGNLKRLASELFKEGKNDKAIEILDLSIDKMPIKEFGYYSSLLDYVDLYYKLGEKEKARKIADFLTGYNKEYLDYYAQLPLRNQQENAEDIQMKFIMYREILKMCVDNKDETFADPKFTEFEQLLNKFNALMGE
jgi:hypothetical protein